jgi:hypothetical protein
MTEQVPREAPPRTHQPDLTQRIDAAIAGSSLTELIPLLTGYLANCGVHGLVPRDAFKSYVCGVIDEVYEAFSAPTDKEKIQ